MHIELYPDPHWCVSARSAELLKLGIEFGHRNLNLKNKSKVVGKLMDTWGSAKPSSWYGGRVVSPNGEYDTYTRIISLNIQRNCHFLLAGVCENVMVLRTFLTIWHEQTHQLQQEHNRNQLDRPSSYESDFMSLWLEPTEIEARVKSDLLFTMLKADDNFRENIKSKLDPKT